MFVKRAFCLFEQSGTFKNEFIKLGVPAFDIDIKDNFGQTDKIEDLFNQIELAYNGEYSLFDDICKDDLMLAFFPCTRFDSQINMLFLGNSFSMKNWSDAEKVTYCMNLHSELSLFYRILCKLFLICYRKNLRCIIENPASQPHYLTSYFPIKPNIIDRNRAANGDYFKKPTQFWFINCFPEDNVFFECLDYVPTYSITKSPGINCSRQEFRSLMHPQYARRFIKQYILNGE